MNRTLSFFFTCFLYCFIISCNKSHFREKEFLVKDFQEITLDDELCTAVDIIETFPLNKKCVLGARSASLYVVKRINIGDTLYVFDVCQRAPQFAVDNTFKDGYCIMKENVRHYSDNKILKVCVPDTFNIASGSKYIYATVTMLID